MQLPVKTHYAALAMLALAEKHASREPLAARVIAREHGIPNQFLGQILQQLRAAGLIRSTRGANGGFLLVRRPGEISLLDVVEAVCPAATADASLEAASRLSPTVCQVWEELQVHQRELLQAVSLSDLLLRASPASPMFYI